MSRFRRHGEPGVYTLHLKTGEQIGYAYRQGKEWIGETMDGWTVRDASRDWAFRHLYDTKFGGLYQRSTSAYDWHYDGRFKP